MVATPHSKMAAGLAAELAHLMGWAGLHRAGTRAKGLHLVKISTLHEGWGIRKGARSVASQTRRETVKLSPGGHPPPDPCFASVLSIPPPTPAFARLRFTCLFSAIRSIADFGAFCVQVGLHGGVYCVHEHALHCGVTSRSGRGRQPIRQAATSTALSAT